MKPFCIWTFCAAAMMFVGCEEKTMPSVSSTLDSRTLPQQESWNSTDRRVRFGPYQCYHRCRVHSRV